MRKSKKKISGFQKRIPKGKKQSGRKGKSSAVIQSYTLEEKKILAFLGKHPENIYASRALLRETKIANKNTFYDALRKLQSAGLINVDKKHKVSYIPPKADVEAELISLSGGFGFARTAGGDDIFIPGRFLHGAFIGDKLLLTDVIKDDKGYSGAVRKITERGKSLITGTVKTGEYGLCLVPDNAIRYNLEIKKSDLNGAKEGDKVSAIAKINGRGDWAYAVVKTIFGNSQSAKVCADAIIEGAGIPNKFSWAVLKEAKDASEMPITEDEISKRLDLRSEMIFTIDGADAKDLDDAISVEKTDDGFKLGVHIADVSHYVKENSALDNEAFARGTSVYFADRVIPMLPTDLSNGACSLNAGTDKLTFSALITFNSKGEMLNYDFKKSIICSKVRGVYSEVNSILDGTADSEILNKYALVMEAIKSAKELSDILEANAKARGEMDIESGELYFVLDEDGKCIDIKPRTTGEAEKLIEEMMVSANIAASKFAQKNNLPFVYRVHESPRPDRIADLAEILDKFGIDHKELKNEKPTASDFAAVLQRAKDTTKAEVVSQRVLRTMEKARYSDEELGHFGLSLMDYSHFTSPIRRYPDTSIHRILTKFLETGDSEAIMDKYGSFAKESAAASSRNEIRAVTAERSAEDCYAAEFARLHLGEHHLGIISGATSKGIFVKLASGIEGFVSTNDFENSHFLFDGVISHRDRETGFTLTVGDELAIIIASSDVASGRIDFVPDTGADS